MTSNHFGQSSIVFGHDLHPQGLLLRHSALKRTLASAYPPKRLLFQSAGDCASGLGLVHAYHVLMQYNFARVTDIATVLKSLLDSSIRRQFLDLLEHMAGPYP